jgi:predicted ATPase/class 3 adenylate cyclase
MDVGGWLRSLGLGQYEALFRASEIDADILPELTDVDLEKLGVPLGHRKRLLKAISGLAAPETSPAPSASTGAKPHDAAERRQLTVMFCDLVGSTALSARFDPEDLSEVIGAYHRMVAETVARFGGSVARYMGDGVLVLFGHPQAHEDDAERAIRAALAVVDAIVGLRTREQLHVRLGIASGLVVVGDLIGQGAARERDVVGETPNLAARLQALAPPGTVVIADSTRRQIGGLFEVEDLGPQSLAGFVEPQRAWRVLGESSVLSRFEALRSGATPLIGRDEEIDQLLGCWKQAKGGEGQVVMVSGEPGIGKSRLTSELGERLKSDPHTRLRYFCSPHYQDSALYPFSSQLERAAGFTRDDSAGAKRGKLDALLAEGARGREDIELIAELLSLPSEADELNLSSQQKREKVFEALLHQLASLAGGLPILMVFEDAQWIDPTSRELIGRMIQQMRHWPVLLVVTYRPEFQHRWTGEAHVTMVELNRLGEREGAALVLNLAGHATLEPTLVAEIVDRTDGVPLFVEELTKAVLEGADPETRVAAVLAASPGGQLAIPPALYASLTARLDRLGPAAKEVAQVGAVLGREFTYELLDRVANRRDLEVTLHRLADADLLSCHGLPPRSSYLFKHSLVQDVAYSTLLRTRRQELHARVALVLSKYFTDLVDHQPELVAHHLNAAGDNERAIDQWLKAGQLAASRSANLEAIAHLQRGIQAIPAFPDGTKDRTELKLLYALGPCVIATQGPISDMARETFARARALCERLDNAPEHLNVLYWLAVAHGLRGELSQAAEATEAGIALAEARDDRPALINSLRGAALAHLLTGHLDKAQDRCQRAVDIFNASDEVEQLATRAAGQDAGVAGLALMSWALWAAGYSDAAVARINLSLDRADSLGHPHTQAYVCYYASIVYALRREATIAIRYAGRCHELSVAHDFGHWRSLSFLVQGICTSLLDHSSEALDAVQTALEALRVRGYQMGITALYVLQCEALLQRHQFARAKANIAEALATVRRTGEQLFEAELYRLQAEAHLGELERADPERAHSMLANAITTAGRQGAKLLELRAATSLARLYCDQGQPSEARELLAPICAWFTEGFDTADLTEAKALLEGLA